jgi:RNA polymerase sigma-32 factor
MQAANADANPDLFHSYHRLVVDVARRFRGSGVAMEDLIQEGNLGLTIAAKRFDPTRGVSLSTYAYHWIRGLILGQVVRGRGVVSLGSARRERKLFSRLSRVRRKLEQLGGPVDSTALADKLGVPREAVEAVLGRFSQRDVSLDADEGYWSGRLATGGPGPEDAVAEGEEMSRRRALLAEGLGTLDERERAILRARHLTSEPVTLASLGRRMRLSRERVRQLEARALGKLTRYCREHG